MDTKHCYSCKATKLKGEFYRNKRQRDGLSSQCAACSREAVRRSRQKKSNKLEVG